MSQKDARLGLQMFGLRAKGEVIPYTISGKRGEV
jgi:hypothetical protein